MRRQLPENILVILLKQCYLAPSCRCAVKRRPTHSLHHTRSLRTSTRQQQYSAGQEQDEITFRDAGLGIGGDSILLAKSGRPSFPSPKSSHSIAPHPPQNIAVLGGGITGLATAVGLARELPNASITLYEASDRFGGWLRSKHVNVGNGNIVFEQGPRTIRPHGFSGLFTLALVVAPEIA
jgi:oxygen-dependent protoporphyrinogen oxidase